MIGAVAGDIVGSVYEHQPIKTKDFPLFDRGCRFTDDTVLTLAVAQAVLTRQPYARALRTMGTKYPHAGYGGSFIRWLTAQDPQPYNSWGNGAAMRVGPVGWAFADQERVLLEARRTAEPTHNHPEGIKGAQATALAIFLARTGHAKEEIRSLISRHFGYRLDLTVDRIRPSYAFDISCQGTVPAAMIAFFDAHSFEDAVRNAVSLGGDSDTLACITGSIAEAFYHGVPDQIAARAREKLTPELLEILDRFERRYGPKGSE